MSSDGQVSLREYLGERLDRLTEDVAGVRGMVEALASRVAIQNGRVDKLEVSHAVLLARAEERERAAAEAQRIAEATAKRHAAAISTVISLVGVIAAILSSWVR